MSDIQGVKSSVDDEVLVTEETKNKLTLSTNDEQPSTSVLPTAKTEEQNHVNQEIKQNVTNTGELLNVESDKTNDETVPTKQDKVNEESVSGECRNILPVLVEHLRSALELSAINQNPSIVDEPLAPDGLIIKPSLFHSDAQHTKEDSTISQQTLLYPMDLKFFEDILLADIKTGLMRLQDMLRQVDVDALSVYNLNLEPDDKLHLLQMISNLVTNLRMIKLEDVSRPPSSVNKSKQHHSRTRDRHTIGVSREELARARKWLEEKGSFSNNSIASSPRSSIVSEPQSNIFPQQTNVNSVPLENSREQVFDNPQACEKHMKDAINQQQSLQNRNKDVEGSNPNISTVHDTEISLNVASNDRHNEIIDTSIDCATIPTSALMIKSSNKFTAKKSKIKRANTIDIPNYLKLHAENDKKSSSPGLRRPIDISDRLSWNPPQIHNMAIPSFEPKTENDRKFLALINRNNETNGCSVSNCNSPFKTFNYRQTSSITDKNWKSRFSNIKTTFDKSSSPSSLSLTCESPRQDIRDENKPSNKQYLKIRDKPLTEATIPSAKLPQSIQVPNVSQNNFPPRKYSVFTHATSSPFQKIQNFQQHTISKENPILSSSYLPVGASSGMLRAKLKLFDHQQCIVDPLLEIKPECPRMNLCKSTEKIVPIDSGSNNNQIKNTNNFNNKPNRLFFNNYSRRNSMYTENTAQLDENTKNFQPRQSIAVQTINYPIETSKRTIDANHHDSFTISQSIDPHSNQQLNQLHQSLSPSTPLTLPKKYYYENDDTFYVPPYTEPVHNHNSIINDSYPAITNGISNKYVNSNLHSNHDNCNNRYIHNDTCVTKDHSFMDDENIENQDMFDNNIVTRYPSAIVTLEKSPPQIFSPTGTVNSNYEQSKNNTTSASVPIDQVQRHNMLQQSLIRQLHHQDNHPLRSSTTVTPSQRYPVINCEQEYTPVQFNQQFVPLSTIKNDHESCSPIIENNNTQEKINLFEGKSIVKNDYRTGKPLALTPLKLWPSTPDRPKPEIHISKPLSTSWKHTNDYPPIGHSPSTEFKYQTGPGDTSDEYLVSCASRPHRSIVLSKSESWHQLAMSKNYLQVPPQQIPELLDHKPPTKIPLHSSKNLDCKQLDKLKKMEEKVQKYFNSNSNALPAQQKGNESNHICRKSISPRKSQGILARSRTMSNICDELTDIDTQFNNLFEETIHDKRH